MATYFCSECGNEAIAPVVDAKAAQVAEDDLCVCGHEDHLHVERNKRRECTVCVCDSFSWAAVGAPAKRGECADCDAVIETAVRLFTQYGDGALALARKFSRWHPRGSDQRAFWLAVAESIADAGALPSSAPPSL